MRAELLARRLAVRGDERKRIGEVVTELVRERFAALRHTCIGFYWPFKGEIDLRGLVGEFLAQGATASLPVVTEKNRPLAFWAWQPGAKLGRGIWNIPAPADPVAVRPTVLLVPLLGFDNAGYRLGYGGGYYDRTLAVMNPTPLTIGVGFELGRMETIHPQPHDVSLDVIVSEAGVTRHGARVTAGSDRGIAGLNGQCGHRLSAYASPPCFMHEIEESYMGNLSSDEIVAVLNLLLEGERAGSRGVAELAARAENTPDHAPLHAIALDEARFCRMLIGHIRRLGGEPSPQTGAFYETLLAADSEADRTALLVRGQQWVVRKLDEILPRIRDDALHADLADMRDVHIANVARCRALAPAAEA